MLGVLRLGFRGSLVRRFCVTSGESLPPNRKRGSFAAYDANKDWTSYGLAPTLLERTRSLGFKGPSCIQDIAIPIILRPSKDKAFVIGAETGSGKTLSYLLPVIHKLFEKEKDGGRRRMGLQGEKLPFAIIMVPNVELAYQCKSVVAHLLSGTPFTVAVSCQEGGEGRSATPFPEIGTFPTILVTTPRTLVKHWKAIFCLHVKYLVVDEADLLLQETSSHFPGIKRILMEVRYAAKDYSEHPEQTTVIFAGATFGDKKVASKLGRSDPGFDLKDAVSKQFSRAKWICSPLLHYKLPTIRHEFIFNYMDQVEPKKDKLLLLLKNRLSPHQTQLAARQGGDVTTSPPAAGFLEDNGVKEPLIKTATPSPRENRGLGQKILVFFNDIQTLESVSRMLTSKGFIHGAVHEKMPSEERITTLKHYHNGTIRLLCTTNLLARGVDFVKVNCVIQFEMAKNISEHIHRIGRTARAGSSGQAFSFYNQFDYGLVQAIKECGEGDLKPVFKKKKAKTKADRFPEMTIVPRLATLETAEEPVPESERVIVFNADRWSKDEPVPTEETEQNEEEPSEEPSAENEHSEEENEHSEEVNEHSEDHEEVVSSEQGDSSASSASSASK